MDSLWQTEISLSLTGRKAFLTSVLWSSPLGKTPVLWWCKAWDSRIEAELFQDKRWTIENRWNAITSGIGELIGIIYFRIENNAKRIVWLFLDIIKIGVALHLMGQRLLSLRVDISLFQKLIMVFLFSEAVTVAIEFGNFDCNEVNIGTHGFGNLLNIVTSVYQFFYHSQSCPLLWDEHWRFRCLESKSHGRSS